MRSTKSEASRAECWLANPLPEKRVRCTICLDDELARELRVIFEGLAKNPEARSRISLVHICTDFVRGVLGRQIHPNTLGRHRHNCLAELGPW